MAAKPSRKKLPPEQKFPNRLAKVRRTGIEIASSIGNFRRGANACRASFCNFDIFYFTPFNPPYWLPEHWADRVNVYGLIIYHDDDVLLKMLWSGEDQIVDEFDFGKDDRDQRLREEWYLACMFKPRKGR